MSNGSLQQIMNRIKSATPKSQIAVFRTDNPELLNAVFAATVLTQDMINANDLGLIGVYDRTMNLQDVKAELAGDVLAINAELLAMLHDCESYAYAMGKFNNSGEGAQLAVRCRELIDKVKS